MRRKKPPAAPLIEPDPNLVYGFAARYGSEYGDAPDAVPETDWAMESESLVAAHLIGDSPPERIAAPAAPPLAHTAPPLAHTAPPLAHTAPPLAEPVELALVARA